MTFRCLVIRELVSWRFFDLLEQSVILLKNDHILGAQILLRSAIETLSLLIYTNQKMESIVRTGEGFHEFSSKTSRLLLGSKNKTTSTISIHISTILEAFEKQYNGTMDVYDNLSESTHPNYQGFTRGYSKNDFDNFKVNFENCWVDNFKDPLEGLIDLFLRIFEFEYNEQWPEKFEKFEKWIEKNDKKLENTK